MDVDMNWGRVADDAVALSLGGCSCSQAVAGAFSRQLGLDEKLFLRVASPLAGGMLSGNVCGVVGAGLLILGALFGPESAQDVDRKQRIVLLGSEFMGRFADAHDSVLCSELWTETDIHTPEGAKACRASGRPEQLIRSGAELLRALLREEGID